MVFNNLITAQKRAFRIKKQYFWLDLLLLVIFKEWLFKKLANKFPWTYNYPWIRSFQKDESKTDKEKVDFILLLLFLADDWASSINRWCDKNMVDDAPYSVRVSCRMFIYFIRHDIGIAVEKLKGI